jgi:hypothetical protein
LQALHATLTVVDGREWFCRNTVDVDVDEDGSQGTIEVYSDGDEESHSKTRSMLTLVLILLSLMITMAFPVYVFTTKSSLVWLVIDRVVADMSDDSPPYFMNHRCRL